MSQNSTLLGAQTLVLGELGLELSERRGAEPGALSSCIRPHAAAPVRRANRVGQRRAACRRARRRCRRTCFFRCLLLLPLLLPLQELQPPHLLLRRLP